MPARVQWVARLDGAPRRVNHAAICLENGTILSFGGYCNQVSFTTPLPMDIHALDTHTLRWRRLKSRNGDANGTGVPYLRYGHTAVEFMNCGFVWGGRNDVDGASNTLHQFDPREGLWRAVGTASGSRETFLPPARDGHSACVHRANMVVFGGFEDDFRRFSQETFAFDFRANSWKQLLTEGRPPSHRDFHSACTLGERMYVFGGRSDAMGEHMSNQEQYHSDVHVLHLDGPIGRWERWPALPDPTRQPSGRRSHTAWVHQGKMYIFGGYCGIKNEHFSSMHEFDPVSGKWRQVQCCGVGPSARRRHCSLVYNETLFLFGGSRPKGGGDFSTSDEENSDENSMVDLADLHVAEFSQSCILAHCLRCVLLHKQDLGYVTCRIIDKIGIKNRNYADI